MFNDLKKTVLVILGVLFYASAEGTMPTPVPTPLTITSRCAVPGNREIQNGGVIYLSDLGSVVRDPNTTGVKLRHPKTNTGYKTAKIEITAGIGEGDASRLSTLFSGFTNIARLIIPYICVDLITTDTAGPSSGGWKGIVGVTSDDEDGLHMFSPSVASYFNALPVKDLVLDVSDPDLPAGIDTSPNDSTKNTVLKVLVATLDPTDSTLPAYDSVTSPCGIETEPST